MNTILVDANVILDLFTNDPVWATWSEGTLADYTHRADLCINDIIYCEISIGFERIEDLDAAILDAGFRLLPIPKPALFLAGKAYLAYKRRKGSKRSPLPDFFIGAQAAVLKLDLITRDVSRYRSYFPTVNLISPQARLPI